MSHFPMNSRVRRGVRPTDGRRPGSVQAVRGRPIAIMPVLLLVVAACDAVGRSPEVTSPTTPTPAGAPTTPVPAPHSARLVAPPGGSFLIHGRFPRTPTRCVDPERPRFVARYPGAATVRRADDGTLTITVTVPFERYLEGIAEVPSSWPAAALEAQAVAARSYALATTGWSGAEGEALDRPICATSSCQVYRGIPVPHDPHHRRWVRAVRSTRGEVLLTGDRPATTVYFSTSNGHTYGNEDVFGTDPLSYLRPVPERDDGASPTARWSVQVPFPSLSRFLAAEERWPRGRRITSVRPRGSSVEVAGGGRVRRLSLADLRDAVNTWAPCLEPDRFPGPLPVTIPSSWFEDVSVRDGALSLSGRGWGHGVGMVQWGAYGKARRGWSSEEILAYYYGGLRPEPFPEPGTIRVVVASGLTRVIARPSRAGARLDGEPLSGRRVVVAPTPDGLSASG